jgi:hypothetical protein
MKQGSERNIHSQDKTKYERELQNGFQVFALSVWGIALLFTKTSNRGEGELGGEMISSELSMLNLRQACRVEK